MNRFISICLVVLLAAAGPVLPGSASALPPSAAPGFRSEADRDSAASPGFALAYDFETGREGWAESSYETSRGILGVQQSADRSRSGSHSLQLSFDLDGSSPNRAVGEAMVDMAQSPPAGFPPAHAVDLENKTIAAWLYVPAGARGEESRPNSVHLFAMDTLRRSLYGSAQYLPAEGWVRLTLYVANALPACGYLNSGFDPTHLWKIGVNVSAAAGSAARFRGYMVLDSVEFGVPQPLASDHLYTFANPDANARIPYWRSWDDWGGLGLDAPQVQAGALAAAAHFTTASDAQRSGIIGIQYAPALDLSQKSHQVISAEVRFDPPAVTPAQSCPFMVSIWVYDGHKQKWFRSDDIQAGAGGWERISFDLGDPAQWKPGVQDDPGDMPTRTDISRVGFLVWANTPYTGKILFDNIVIGGVEALHPAANAGIVQSQGGQFMVNAVPFRFIGADAEYLFLMPIPKVAQVLDQARSMGITVMRTWGFSDGCENTLPDCILWSPRFQPAAGLWNEAAFEHFDRIMAMAGERGIRLIVPLANNWGEYGGRPQYLSWLAQAYPGEVPLDLPPGSDAYHDLFYTNPHIKQWYQAYVTHFLTRANSITGIPYNQDPTIFAWELINEPRAPSDVSGRILHEWIVEMSRFLNDLDPNHMIGTGEEGWYVMPKAEADLRGTLPGGTQWQSYPNNYWEMGVNWQPENGPTWGSSGVDFLSDHSSAPTTVCWQPYAGEIDKATMECNLREGVPDVDYASMHLYISAAASNLYRAPYCDAGFDETLCSPFFDRPFNQAFQWIAEHVQDAAALGKPLLIGEFGFRASGLEQIDGHLQNHYPPFTQPQRAKLFQMYLDNLHLQGVQGALFWNLGVDGYPENPWDGADSLVDAAQNPLWRASSTSDAVEVHLCPAPVTPTEGRYSLCAAYDPQRGQGKAFLDRVNIPQESADWSAPSNWRLRFDIYVAQPLSAIVGIITSTGQTWYESSPQPLHPGWNTVTVDTTAQTWKSLASNWQNNTAVGDLSGIRQVSIGITGYADGGVFYVDNLRHVNDDGLVLYPGDPAISVIGAEICQHWRNCRYLPEIRR